tara:strand:- start:463 stop:672 length:210 start_codon:yes stop_codon:yes gene_type:complete
MFYTENEIQKILYKYETGKEYRRIYYKEKYNTDLEFRKKKQAYQRKYYHDKKNKEKKGNILEQLDASKE